MRTEIDVLSFRLVRRYMGSEFLKASGIVLAGWMMFVLIGDPRPAVYGALPLQLAWFAFCVVRLAQLCWRGAFRSAAPAWERESFGFALGGVVAPFAVALLAASIPVHHR